MRRTRHVVLPVRSWQYIGLLLVSLACVTFGLVARDREGQAGSLTGPELLHRAPHDVDVCPNLEPFQKPPACLDSLEKPNLVSKNNERRVIDSSTVRIERRRSVEPSTSSIRLPERRLARSLERMDERIRNVRSINRKSPNMEVQTYSRRLARDFTDRTRRLSRTFNERSRSIDRREEREIERRALENREFRERRERFEVASRKTIGTRNVEKREIRGNDRSRNTIRLIREERDGDRERAHDRRSNSAERRESRVENRDRRLINERRDGERRISRLNTLNREHRSSSMDTERRNSRIDISDRERRLSSIRDRTRRTLEIRTTGRQSIGLTDRRDIERRNTRSEIRNAGPRSQERLDSANRRENRRKIEILDRRSRSTDRLDSNRLDRERRLTISLERRVSAEREAPGNHIRRENQRLDRRTTDFESRRLLDRRSRSLDRRTTNGLDRERRLLGLERKVVTEGVSENLNRRENQREFANRLSRSRFTVNRDFRKEMDRTRLARSSESSDISKDRRERHKIFLSRGSLERRSLDSTDRREIDTLTRIVRSIAPENKNSLRIARYSSDSSLARTRNEHTDRREQRLTRERINDDYRSRVNKDSYLSRQEKRSSRRSNSMERRESFENRRIKTDNDRRSTISLTVRREIQQRGPITRATSAVLRTNDLRERRSFNTRIQERFTRNERNANENRRIADSRSIGKLERLMESRSRDQRRNVHSNLTVERNLERRNSDSRIRYTNSRIELEKGLKRIERSRDNVDRRSIQRRLVDLKQSDSLREKLRTSEIPTRIRDTLIVPSIDRDRLYSVQDRSLERNKRFFDLDRRVRKITKDSRDDEYGRKIGLISDLLKTNTLSNYDLTFSVIRQAFVITICIVYGLSMSNSKKLFTGNLMDRINRFALR